MSALSPWLETLLALSVAALGAAGGWAFSRVKSRWWALGYVLPLVVIVAIGLGRRFDALTFGTPFGWLVDGRTEYLLCAVACPMILIAPLSRLNERRKRIAVLVLAAVLVCLTVLPFLTPALVRGRLLRLETTMAPDGICVQTADYTCGPASAVTALRRLGLPAEEGELSILARTNPFTGTHPAVLARVIRERYEADGLAATYRPFKSIEELKSAGTAIVVIKFSLLVDHYVTFIDATDKEVIVGDPLVGARRMSHAEFESIWRHSGIQLSRTRSGKQ